MARMNRKQLAERRETEWAMYVDGWTQPQIAKHFGIEQSTVSDDLRVFREAIPPQTREQMIERHHAKLADIARRLEEIAGKPAPPVTAGKDGRVVVDPATGQLVRDYSAQATALREIRATLAQEAKLAGLNAADKVEVSGNVTVNSPVDQEMEELARQLGMQAPTALAAGCTPAELSEGVGSDAPAS